MAGRKVVRLRDVISGVVVETTEENAKRLTGFEPVEATTKRSSGKAEK